MNEQLSFVKVIQDSFVNKLQNMLDVIIVEQELPPKSLHLFSNMSKRGDDVGKETSKSICIYEQEYPPVKEDVDNPGKNYVVMNFQQKEGSIELLIRPIQYECIETPKSATVKENKSDKNFIHVVFSETDTSVYSYIRHNINYCLKKYRSKSKTFGCCSRFIQCSDALKCVHPNKLYATACTYKRNLENGNIFYGKNKNI